MSSIISPVPDIIKRFARLIPEHHPHRREGAIPHRDAEVQRTAKVWLTTTGPEKGRDAENDQGLRRRRNLECGKLLPLSLVAERRLPPLPSAVHLVIGNSLLDIGYSPLPSAVPPSAVHLVIGNSLLAVLRRRSQRRRRLDIRRSPPPFSLALLSSTFGNKTNVYTT